MSRRCWICVPLLVLSVFLVACGTNPAITQLAITPTSATLTAVGQTTQFKATASFLKSNQTQFTQDVTSTVEWTSSNPSVATVDATGLAKAVSGGTTAIVATLHSGSSASTSSASLTVNIPTTPPGPPPHELLSIAITPSSQTLTGVGQLGKFIAIGTFSTAPTTQDLTNQVKWQSSSPQVATIDATGVATATGPGTATITATGVSNSGAAVIGTASLTETSAQSIGRDLVSVSIIPTAQTLTSALQKAQFTAVGTYSGPPSPAVITNNVKWGSSLADVATIDSGGLATAQGRAGTTVITATAPTQTGVPLVGTATLTEQATAVQNRELLSISVIPNNQPVGNPGDTAQFIAVGTYSTAPVLGIIPRNVVTWASSVVQYATIDSNGLATAIGPGLTFISATYHSTSGADIVGVGTMCVACGPATTSQLPTLTVIKLGGVNATLATITSSPASILCGSACSASFPLNSTVKLFSDLLPVSWSGNCLNPSAIAANGATSDDGKECDVNMATNTVVAAAY